MSELLEAALAYAAMGYRVFPCIAGGKVPATESGCLDATADEEAIEKWWGTCPAYNIGISTDGLLVVDIDGSENPWLRDDIDKLMDITRCPITKTPKGGTHRWFRQPPGEPYKNTVSFLADKIDTRANGGYVVAAPSIVDGKPYVWIEDLEKPERLTAPPGWLLEALNSKRGESTSVRLITATPSHMIPDGQRNATLAKLAGNMRRVGMSASEILASMLVTNQTRCNPPLPEIEVEKIVASICRYEPDQVATAVAEDHWSQLCVPEEQSNIPEDAGAFPRDCLRPPGLIELICEYNISTALYPQPELALAGAIALMGAITGRKITDHRGTRTNVYCVGLAPSGSGKEHARKVNKELLEQCGGMERLGPERIASSAGLVSFVAERKSVLFQLDEIGRLMATMKDARNSHLYNIAAVFMQLYGSADQTWQGDAYADMTKTKTVNQPHCCVYGTCVPKEFWGNLTQSNVTEGLLGRFLPFESPGYVDSQDPQLGGFPWGLLDGIQAWVEYKPYGNGDMWWDNPKLEVAHYSTEAEARLISHMAEICERRKKDDDTRAALWSRSAGKAASLALIYACSRSQPGRVRVELPDIDMAIKTSNWLTRMMLKRAFDHVADNLRETNVKRVLRLLEKPITMSTLSRKTQWLNGRRERMDILQDLQDSGLIEMVEQIGDGTKPATYIQQKR